MGYHRDSARRRKFSGINPDFSAALLNEENRERHRNPKWDHKTLQLCAQVRDALSLALAGECNDDLLRQLYVDGVQPAPTSARLLCRLVIPRHAEVKSMDVYARLDRVGSHLRGVVARSISRKRAPELAFVVVPESEVQS